MSAGATVMRRQRFVYVGASNFARALPQLWTSLRIRARADSGESRTGVDLLAACGLGRAYGSSSVFGISPIHRTLTAVRNCRLWTELGRSSDPVQGAWIGDLGNDIAYGADASQLLRWLDQCLAAIPEGAAVVVVEPAVEPISGLGEFQFALLAKMLFPGRSLSRERVVGELTTVRQALRERWGEPRSEDGDSRNGGDGEDGGDESSRAVTLVRTPTDWIGWDRIHVRADRRVEWVDRLIDAANQVGTSSVSPQRSNSPTASLRSGVLPVAPGRDSRMSDPSRSSDSPDPLPDCKSRTWWRLRSESSVLSVLGTRWKLGREQPAVVTPDDGSRLFMF